MAGKPTMATMRVGGRPLTVISFTARNQYKVNGYINAQHVVEKVETWVANPTLGDTLIETTFADYRYFGGMKFPMRIVQAGRIAVLELNVGDVRERRGDPAGAGRGRSAAARVAAEKFPTGSVFAGHPRSEQHSGVQRLQRSRRVFSDRRARTCQHRRGETASAE